MLYEAWLQLRGEAPEERRIETADRGLALTYSLWR
jgi:acetyl-CoA C-acetyltransferase